MTTNRYYIRYEIMGGDWYYMIYRKRFLGHDTFEERWNTPQSAITRLKELNY